MSLPLTVALSFVVILMGVAIPALMCAFAHITGSFRVWTGMLCAWLVVVFAWVLLQFHLYSLAPAYFQDPGPWDAINGWPAFFALVFVVASFIETVDSH